MGRNTIEPIKKASWEIIIDHKINRSVLPLSGRYKSLETPGSVDTVMESCCYNITGTMKTRLIVVTLITNIVYEAAIIWGLCWLLPRYGLQVPLWTTILVALIFAGWAAFCFNIGLRTIQRKPLNGFTSLVGMEGIAKGRLDPAGYIRIDGALWAAESETGSIKAGTKVEVVRQNGLKLVVRAR